MPLKRRVNKSREKSAHKSLIQNLEKCVHKIIKSTKFVQFLQKRVSMI